MPQYFLFGNTISTVPGAQASLTTAVSSTYGLDVPPGATTWDVSLTASGTAGGVVIFESLANPTGTVWGNAIAVRTDSPAQAVSASSAALVANTVHRYRVPVSGMAKVRMRVTTALGATLADLTTAFTAEPATPVSGTVTIGGTSTVSGTVTANTATPSNYALTTTASTNAASVKNGAATLFGGIITNPAATTAYVKLYNKASAPTVGTDSPLLTIPVAAGATVSLTPGTLGIRFGTGLAIAVTGAGTDADTSNAVAGVKIDLAYV